MISQTPSNETWSQRRSGLQLSKWNRSSNLKCKWSSCLRSPCHSLHVNNSYLAIDSTDPSKKSWSLYQILGSWSLVRAPTRLGDSCDDLRWGEAWHWLVSPWSVTVTKEGRKNDDRCECELDLSWMRVECWVDVKNQREWWRVAIDMRLGKVRLLDIWRWHFELTLRINLILASAENHVHRRETVHGWSYTYS